MFLRSMIIAGTLLLNHPALGHAADPPVSLELVTEPGFPIEGRQRWIQFLRKKEFGFTHLRIRSARADDVPKIENRGTDAAPRYEVTGILMANGRMAVPGLLLRNNRSQELITWLEGLRRGGEDAVTAFRGAFGLTAKQLTSLTESMKKRVVIPTKGKKTSDVLQHIRQTLKVQVEFDSSAQRLLSSDDKMLDELSGLSCGTALAAAVRPHGLLVTPTGQGTRTVGLRVTRSAKPQDAWPVGMKPKSGAAKLAPALLKFINVEIVDQPLDDTLDAIQGRLKIPFLYDHNALARHEVDLHDTVSLAPKKTFYKKIIDLLLFQKLLVAELRTDEAGTGFLWITSAKK